MSKYGIGPCCVKSFFREGWPQCAHFIHNFPTIAESLQVISRQEMPFVWGSKQEESFQELYLF